MPLRRVVIGLATLLGALVLGSSLTSAGTGPDARWRPHRTIDNAVDVVGPRRDGRLVVAAAGGLFRMRPAGRLTPFARGPGGYASAGGGEPYIALAPQARVRGAACSFRRDDVYALVPGGDEPGVVRVSRRGVALRFADLPAGSFATGIAFDTVGRYGRRLLVTVRFGEESNLYAIDCRGRVRAVVKGGPRVEGGIAVAPRSFGRFAGQLIAADELGGGIFAFTPRGTARLVAPSGLPAGPDVGVESVGFVPPGFDRRAVAYLADLALPNRPGPAPAGILALSGGDLLDAGARPGDMVVATETGATTITVRCRRRCFVRRVAEGPGEAHAEGHVTFGRAP